MIYQSTSAENFFETCVGGKTSLLFIKEQGCRYCEIAEAEMKRAGLPEALGYIKFFECSIDQEPDLAIKLGLVGVPEFLRVDGNQNFFLVLNYETT